MVTSINLRSIWAKMDRKKDFLSNLIVTLSDIFRVITTNLCWQISTARLSSKIFYLIILLNSFVTYQTTKIVLSLLQDITLKMEVIKKELIKSTNLSNFRWRKGCLTLFLLKKIIKDIVKCFWFMDKDKSSAGCSV